MTTTNNQSLDRDELLLKAAMMAQRMTSALSAEKKPLIRDQRSKLRFYKNAFLGSEALGWAVETGFAQSRPEAVKLFDDFLTVGALLALSRRGHVFKDESLYSWPEIGPGGAPVQREGSARGSVSGEDEEVEAAVGDMAKLLHLHTVISEKNKLRQEEWRKSQLPQIKKKIEDLDTELGNWRKKLEAAVEKAKRIKEPDAESLIVIDELEVAAASVMAESDNQKQLMYFPEPERWVYRFGSDGVYVGIKHPHLERIEAKWSIRAGSALMPNPAIKDGGSGHHFEMKFSPAAVSVAFDGLSVVGEKGSGVPSFSTDHLALDMELLIEAQLQFNPATSTWKAPYFHFNLVDLGKTEVLGVPPALLQWVINKFAPERVKQAILGALPVALGRYLSGGGEVLEVSGNLSMRGIPFPVLDYSLELGRGASLSPEDVPPAHWSALKLLGTGIDCITHGNTLARLRRRLGLTSLAANSLFKNCSKWTSISTILLYVRTLDRDATSMELSEIMRTWQHALNNIAAEDGVSPIDLQALFDRLRLLDKTPFEVSYVVSEFNGSFDIGRLVDSLGDMGNEFLNIAKTDITDVKVLNELRKNRSFEEIDAWHADVKEMLRKVTDSLQKMSVALSGRLLGGKEGIFDVGTDTIMVRLKPGVQFPLDEILMAPSDTSLSLFAVEDKGGKFVVDVGVPKSEKITEDVAETKNDSLLSFCTGEFWKRNNTTEEGMDASEVYDASKHFPTHDRVVMLNVGSASLSLRADAGALMKKLAAAQKEEEGLADLFTVEFNPAKASTSIANSASPNLTPVSSPRGSISKISTPRASISKLAAPVDTTTSAPTTPVAAVQTTITAASVALPPLDLPSSTAMIPPTPGSPKHATAIPPTPGTPTHAATFHLSAPTPSIASTALATPNAFDASTAALPSPNPISSLTITPAPTPIGDNVVRKNSLGSSTSTIPVSTPTNQSSSVKRNSLGSNLVPPNTAYSAPSPSKKRPSVTSNQTSDAPKLPSYTLGLQCIPDLFAQLVVKDFRLMGAPRRISKFIHSTVVRPELEKKRELEGKSLKANSETAAVAIETKASTDLGLTDKNRDQRGEETGEKKSGDKSSQLDPIHVALHNFLHDIGSDSMHCHFTHSIDVTVQDGKVYVTLSRSNNKRADARPFVFSNTYIASDLFEKVMRVHSAIEKVRAEG